MGRALKMCVAVAGIVACAAAFAGQITPPAGPVAGTFKTIGDVEPRTLINSTNTPGDAGSVYVISQSGSYYLGANFTAPSGKHGIRVAANDVTIDLNGFTIGAVISGTKQGITIDGVGYTDITVRNGTVRGFDLGGIDLYACSSGSIENVRVLYNTVFGIRSQSSGIVRGCNAEGNYGDGIVVYVNAVAEECTATDNGGSGFASSYGTCTLRGCRAIRSTAHGFNFNGAAVLDHCVAHFNHTDGFVVGDDSVLDGCAAIYNEAIGVYAGNRTTVRSCMSNYNSAQGIYVNDYCTVLSNQTLKNGGGCCAGIYLQGSGNRCEDNECAQNYLGLYVSGTDNMIMKNSCRANAGGNYTIAAGNELAPIVTNPGSNNFTTATPWSNFAY